MVQPRRAAPFGPRVSWRQSVVAALASYGALRSYRTGSLQCFVHCRSPQQPGCAGKGARLLKLAGSQTANAKPWHVRRRHSLAAAHRPPRQSEEDSPDLRFAIQEALEVDIEQRKGPQKKDAAGSEAADERLLAALARFPVLTRHKGRAHPKIGFRKADDMFDWDNMAEELGMKKEEAMVRAFGPGGKTFNFIRQRTKVKHNLPKFGILVQNDVITKDEEQRALTYLRGEGMSWQPRENHALRANFGPTLTSQYKVHRRYRLTKIPSVLQSMRRKVLEVICSSEDVRRYAMTPRAREGYFGHSEEECFNQALLQRYQAGVRPEDPRSQALAMHLDQRDDWAEVIAAVNLGGPGHVFFDASKPGTCLTDSEMRRLVKLRKGVLIQLPPRSAYIFYGFARYGLCHGVAGPNGSAASSNLDRITVTWRSVRQPPAPEADPPRDPLAGGAEATEDIGLWGQYG